MVASISGCGHPSYNSSAYVDWWNSHILVWEYCLFVYKKWGVDIFHVFILCISYNRYIQYVTQTAEIEREREREKEKILPFLQFSWPASVSPFLMSVPLVWSANSSDEYWDSLHHCRMSWVELLLYDCVPSPAMLSRQEPHWSPSLCLLWYHLRKLPLLHYHHFVSVVYYCGFLETNCQWAKHKLGM